MQTFEGKNPLDYRLAADACKYVTFYLKIEYWYNVSLHLVSNFTMAAVSKGNLKFICTTKSAKRMYLIN